MVKTKTCNVCFETKPTDEFYVTKSSVVNYLCKVCQNDRAKSKYDSGPKPPEGGWTKETLQEVYDDLGFDVTVIFVGNYKYFKDVGLGSHRTGKSAYVHNNKTGERIAVSLSRIRITDLPDSHRQARNKTVVRVRKKLLEMDKNLGLMSADFFYKIYNNSKDGDEIYVKVEEYIGGKCENPRYPNKYVHLINHRTGQTGYFQVNNLLSGSVPWGGGGYDPSKPGVFYLIVIDDIVIKFGITNNIVDIRYSGERLDFKKYVTLVEVQFEDGAIPRRMESKVRSMVKGHFYNGTPVFRFTKNKECFWYGDGMKLCEVLEYVKGMKDKNGGEVITWENMELGRGRKKTSTQQSTPMQLSLAL